MNIIDGKKVADDIRSEIIQAIGTRSITPGLAVILVGNDAGSATYVKLKKAAAEKLGIQFSLYKFTDDVPEDTITETIDWLNSDKQIDGIIIQLPLPAHLNEDELVNRIDPRKDADGFHSFNIKKYLAYEHDAPAPGLVDGVMRLIDETHQDTKGAKAVILANSTIFAEPMREALSRIGISASVLLRPSNADIHTLFSADIIITALGDKYRITQDVVLETAIIIDVGYTRANDRVYGDVNPEDMETTDIWLTPVPGGVGPVTVIMLLQRVVELYFFHHGRN